MSIELSSAAPVAPRLDKGPAKNQRAGDEGANQPGVERPSFAALLTSLDGMSAGVAPASDGVPASGDCLPVPVPSDPAMLLAQGQGMAAVSDGLVNLAGNIPSLEVQTPQTVATATLEATPQGLASGSAGLETDQAGRRPPGIQLMTATAASDTESGAGVLANASAPETPGLQVPRRRADQMRRDALSDVSSLDASTKSRSETAQLADSSKSDWRTALAVQAERVAGSGGALTELGGGAFKSLAGMRSSDRQSGRSVFMPLDAGAGFTNSAQGVGGSTSAGTPLVATADAPALVGAASDVAQKVHYWVTRGVQNAELQLDGFDGGSVDVSISLQGNLATVEFRTDESEARRLLQDAMPQLRDMLRSEGLELSSGHVATSAQPDAQPGQQGSGGPGARKPGNAIAPGRPMESAARPVTARAHGLDVFV